MDQKIIKTRAKKEIIIKDEEILKALEKINNAFDNLTNDNIRPKYTNEYDIEDWNFQGNYIVFDVIGWHYREDIRTMAKEPFKRYWQIADFMDITKVTNAKDLAKLLAHSTKMFVETIAQDRAQGDQVKQEYITNSITFE